MEAQSNHDAQIKLEEERKLFDLKSKKVLQILRTKDETIAELEEKIKFLTSSSSSNFHEISMNKILRDLPSYPIREPMKQQLINHDQTSKHEIASNCDDFRTNQYQLKDMERERHAATNSLDIRKRDNKEMKRNDDAELHLSNLSNRISPKLNETSQYTERDNSTSTLFQRKISFDDSQHDNRDRNIGASQYLTPQTDNENDFTQNNTNSIGDSNKKLKHRNDKVDHPATVKVDSTDSQSMIALFKERIQRSEERNGLLERRIHELMVNENQLKERIHSLQSIINEQQMTIKANELEEKLLQLQHSKLQGQDHHPISSLPNPPPKELLYDSEFPNQNFDVNMWWVYVWRHSRQLQQEIADNHSITYENNILQDTLKSQAIEITTAKQNLLALTLRQRRSMEEMQLELWNAQENNMALQSKIEALHTENNGLKDILRKSHSELSLAKYSNKYSSTGSGADVMAMKIELQTEKTSVTFLRAELESSRNKIDQLTDKCSVITKELKAIQSILDVREVVSSITDIPGLHAAQLIEAFSGEIVRLKVQLANSSVKNTSSTSTSTTTAINNSRKDRFLEKLGLSSPNTTGNNNNTEGTTILATALHSLVNTTTTPTPTTSQLVDCLDVIVLSQRISSLQDTIQQLKSYISDLEKKSNDKLTKTNSIHSPGSNSNAGGGESTGNTSSRDDNSHEIEEIIYGYNDRATLNVKLETGIRREVMLKEQLASYKSEIQSMRQHILQLQEEIHKDRIHSLISNTTTTTTLQPQRDAKGNNNIVTSKWNDDYDLDRHFTSSLYNTLPLLPPPPITSVPTPVVDQEDKKLLQRQLCEKSAQIKVLEESLESIMMSTSHLIHDSHPVVSDHPRPTGTPSTMISSTSQSLIQRVIELSYEMNTLSTTNVRLQYALDDTRNDVRNLRNEYTLKILTIDSQNQAIIQNNSLITSLRTELQESQRRFREEMAILERDRDESKEALLESEIEVKNLQSKVCELNSLNQLSENKDYEKWRSRMLSEESLHLSLKDGPLGLPLLADLGRDRSRSRGEEFEASMFPSKSLSGNISELMIIIKQLLRNLSQNTGKSNEYPNHRHHHGHRSHSSTEHHEENVPHQSTTKIPSPLPLTLGDSSPHSTYPTPNHDQTTTTTNVQQESRDDWKPFINKVVTVITGLNGRLKDIEWNQQKSMQENFLLSQKYGNIKSQLKFCAMELVRCRRMLYVNEKLTVTPKSELVSYENRLLAKLRKELMSTKDALWRSQEKELKIMSELRETTLKLVSSESQIQTLKFDWLQLHSRPSSTKSVPIEAKQYALQMMEQRLTEMDRNMKHWCQETIPKLLSGHSPREEEYVDMNGRINHSDMGEEHRPDFSMVLAESYQLNAQLQRQLLVANEQRDVFEKHCLKMEQAILLWNQSTNATNTTNNFHNTTITTTTTGDLVSTHPSQQQGSNYPNNNSQKLFETLQEKSSEYLQQLRIKSTKVLELEESVMKLSSDLSSKEFHLTELRHQYEKINKENQKLRSGSLKEMKKWKRDLEKSHAKELQSFKDSVLRERNSLLEECHRVSLEEEVLPPPINEYYTFDKEYNTGRVGNHNSYSKYRKEPCGHCNCCLVVKNGSHSRQGNVNDFERRGVADNSIESPVSVRSGISSDSSSTETVNDDDVYDDSISSHDKYQRYPLTSGGKKVAEEVDVFPSEVSRQHKKSRVDHEKIIIHNNGDSSHCSLSSPPQVPIDDDYDVSQYESKLSDRERRFDGEDVLEYGTKDFGVEVVGVGGWSMANSNQEPSEYLLQAPPMVPPPPSYSIQASVEKNNQLLVLQSHIARLESQVLSLEREIVAERRKNSEASEQISQLQQMVDVQLDLSSQQLLSVQEKVTTATTNRDTQDVGCQADWESPQQQQQQHNQQYYLNSANISVEQELSQSQCSYPVTEDTLLGQSSVMDSMSTSVHESSASMGGDPPQEMKSHIVELDHLVSALYLSLRAMSDHHQYSDGGGTPSSSGHGTGTGNSPASEKQDIQELQRDHQYQLQQLQSEHEQYIQNLSVRHQIELEERDSFISRLKESIQDSKSELRNNRKQIKELEAQIRNLTQKQMDHDQHRDYIDKGTMTYFITEDNNYFSRHRNLKSSSKIDQYSTYSGGNVTTGSGDSNARRSRSYSWSGRNHTPLAIPAPRTSTVTNRYMKKSTVREDSREERFHRAKSADGRVERNRGRSRDSRSYEGSYQNSSRIATTSEKTLFNKSNNSNLNANDRIAHVEKQLSKLFRTVAGEREINQSIGDIIEDAKVEEEEEQQHIIQTSDDIIKEKEEDDRNVIRTDTLKYSERKGDQKRTLVGNTLDFEVDNETLTNIVEQLKKQLEVVKAENIRKTKLMKEFRSLRQNDHDALQHEKEMNKITTDKLTRLQSVVAGREAALRTLKEKYETLERECAAKDKSGLDEVVTKLKDCETKLLQSRQRISTLKTQLKTLQTESENQRTIIEGFRQKEKFWEAQATDRERKENLLKGLRESREKERQERQEEIEEAALKFKKLKHRYSALERKYSILNSEKEKLFESLTSKPTEGNSGRRSVESSPPIPSKISSTKQTSENQVDLCVPPLVNRSSPRLPPPNIIETEEDAYSEVEDVLIGSNQLLNAQNQRRSQSVTYFDPTADFGENFEDDDDDNDISIDARLLEHISKDVKSVTNRNVNITSPPNQPSSNQLRQSFSTSFALPTTTHENKHSSLTLTNEDSEQENRNVETNFSWADGLFESNIGNDMQQKYNRTSNIKRVTSIATGDNMFSTSADFDRQIHTENKFGNQLWASLPLDSIPPTTTTTQELQDIMNAIGGRTYTTLSDNASEETFAHSNTRFNNNYTRPGRPTINDSNNNNNNNNNNNIPRQPLFAKSMDMNRVSSCSTGRQVSYKADSEKSNINESTSYSFLHTNRISNSTPSERSVAAITSSSLNAHPSPRDSECSSVTSGDDCSAEGRLKALISAALADTPKHH